MGHLPIGKNTHNVLKNSLAKYHRGNKLGEMLKLTLIMIYFPFKEMLVRNVKVKCPRKGMEKQIKEMLISAWPGLHPPI